MQGGPVDELLGSAVERVALDQLEIEVGSTLEDRTLEELRQIIEPVLLHMLSLKRLAPEAVGLDDTLSRRA